VKDGDAKRNANIHSGSFYYAVNKLERMRHATNGTRKRDCRSIANVDALTNAMDAAASHTGEGR
jgi:hypothetical protein